MSIDREVVACDTSVAVPCVVETHAAHRSVTSALNGCSPRLLGHAAVETYSVLTRLPGDARVLPQHAVRLIERWFGSGAEGLQVSFDLSTLDGLARRNISGGATYDALVASAAVALDLVLVTRDLRAMPTYAMVGVRTRLLPGVLS